MVKLGFKGLVAVCFLSCACFAGCSDKAPDAAANPQAGQSSSEQTAPIWLEVKYDDVRLRESAGMKGAVLGTLKTGDQVKDLGEWSKDLETVVLRDQRIKAPWGKVELKDGKQGWIFLGALGPVIDPSIAEFKKELDKLDKTDCKSIAAAVDQFKIAMQGKPKFVADQAVPLLSEVVDAVIDKVNNELFTRSDLATFETMYDEEAIRKAPPKVRDEINAWKACKLHLEFPEGMCVVLADPGIFDDEVGPFVSEPMQKFLAQRKKELGEGYANDGGLVVAIQDLADRAVFWDNFLVEYPTFVNVPFIRSLARNYAVDIVLGLDNTPSLGYEEDGALEKEFKDAYDWVLKEHPNTETAVLVQEWCDLLKQTGWKRSPKTDAYATKLVGL
ncbi:MAG: hypothetical protein RLZZ519_2584 [Bacteroidota bacterium]|jgi:hypothetical protein